MEWRTAGGLLARAVRARLAPGRPVLQVVDDADSDDELPAPPGPPLGAGWRTGPLLDCTACHGARRFPGSVTLLPGTAAGSEVWRRQACAAGSPVALGAAVGTLFGPEAHGPWPTSTARWWPPPQVGPAASANARWDTSRCSACGRWCASLLANRPLGHGVALVVACDRPLPYPAGAALPEFTLTFDGTFRPAGALPATAAAAAVLRGPPGLDAVRPIIATYGERVPAGSALEAEALACPVGLRLFQGVLPGHCLVIGDSPAIVYLAAGAAHVRRSEAALPVVQGIGHVVAMGWRLSWARIPRRFNRDADDRARRAAGLPPRPHRA